MFLDFKIQEVSEKYLHVALLLSCKGEKPRQVEVVCNRLIHSSTGLGPECVSYRSYRSEHSRGSLTEGNYGREKMGLNT